MKALLTGQMKGSLGWCGYFFSLPATSFLRKWHGILLVTLLLSCSSLSKKDLNTNQDGMKRPVSAGLARAIVYKTKADYSHLVPVRLNASKTAITGYPAPADLVLQNRLRLPYPLPNGYWIDNQGIGPDVAFLDYTYEQYAAFSVAPDVTTLKLKIRDADPLLEMWDCGLRDTFSQLTADLATLAQKGFPGCTPLIH